MSVMSRPVFAALLVLGCRIHVPMPPVHADEPDSPALLVRSVAPDMQLAAFLRLFEGSGSPHPAALLASYRRATKNPDVLGKVPQALFAALNPDMVRELRVLDNAVFMLRFDDHSQPHWFLAVPRDPDGTLLAIATALALTDGAPETALAIGGAQVDRIGRPGSPLLARLERSVVLADARTELEAGFATIRLGPGIDPPTDFVSGWLAQVHPGTMRRANQTALRQGAAVLTGLGLKRLDLSVCITEECLRVDSRGLLTIPSDQGGARIEPAWVDLIPQSYSACFAVALDRAGKNLDALFGAVEGALEYDSPAKPGASLRTRVNTMASARGWLPELELWPRLAGVSGFVIFEGERLDRGLLAFHARGQAAAHALARRVLPQFVRAAGGKSTMDAAALEQARSGVAPLGEWGRKSLSIAVRGETVMIGWGELSLSDALVARVDPARSAGDALRSTWDQSPPQRLLAARLDRVPLPGLLAELPVSRALEGTPPIVWTGTRDRDSFHDRVTWTGARATIRQLVELLPRAPTATNRNEP